MTESQGQGFLKTVAQIVGKSEQVDRLMNRLMELAEPGNVFGEPVHSGDYTIITASEVSANIAYGYGIGGGSGTAPSDPGEGSQAETTRQASGEGGGGGGGGGGAAFGRPVAVIVAGPDGVKVTPIVDPTKMALAWFTVMGAMFLGMGQMRRQARKLARGKA